MVHEPLRNLRLDRRLEHRRGWLSPEERERALAALADASDKIAPPEEEAEPASEATAEGSENEPEATE